MLEPDQKGLRDVVSEAWQGGFTLSGDFARKYTPYVAMAASLHLISTMERGNTFGRRWWVTNKGLRWLHEQFATE